MRTKSRARRATPFHASAISLPASPSSRTRRLEALLSSPRQPWGGLRFHGGVAARLTRVILGLKQILYLGVFLILSEDGETRRDIQYQPRRGIGLAGIAEKGRSLMRRKERWSKVGVKLAYTAAGAVCECSSDAFAAD